jgi:peptidoglycan-N-acetylglucosamine deacetylase
MADSLQQGGGVVTHVKVDGDKKYIAFTFDFCATPVNPFGFSEKLADYLARSNVKATAFISGERAAKHPEGAKKLLENTNLEIGLHGWGHQNLRVVTDPELLRAELKGPKKILHRLARELVAEGRLSKEDLPSRQARVFRFPYGGFNDQAVKAVRAAGLTPVQWDGNADASTRPSRDSEMYGKEHVVGPGSILLAHGNDSGQNVKKTGETFPVLHRNMVSEGYIPLGVSELMEKGTPVTINTMPEAMAQYDKLGAKNLAATEALYAKGQCDPMIRKPNNKCPMQP